MSTPGPESPVVLSLRGVSKAFGAVQALRDVSFVCRAGEVHALVGENGSGKSTLLGIASGFLAPDRGFVEIGGRRRRRGSPAEARRFGLGIAYQTYSHVLDLSVAENLYLAVPKEVQPAFGRMDGWATATLEEFKLELPVNAVGPAEVEQLHELVLERGRAGVGIVYVSHRLPEVLGIADRVTVLRDGVAQGTFDAAGMTEESLVALMIGRPLRHAFPERDSAARSTDV